MELPSIGQKALPMNAALDGAESLRDEKDPSEAAAQFEKLLATILVKELRRGLSDGFFSEGPGRDVYEGWLDEHLGAAITDGKGLGLRVALERGLRGKVPGAIEVPEGEVQS